MLRFLLYFLLSIFWFSYLNAQSTNHTLKSHPYPAHVKAGQSNLNSFNQNTALIWSEDFSNGIPAHWINQGYDVDTSQGTRSSNAQVKWEYRGPSTALNNNIGSWGGHKGATEPIQSPSNPNGFIIFDSDFLNNGGVLNPPGFGSAPAPHLGTLTTDTIDCSGFSHVEIAMASYSRKYSSRLMAAISKDGGQSYPDTVEFHRDVLVNGSSLNGERISANISSVAGNEAQVVIQLIFDGSHLVQGARECGGYFWMIDDIEVRALPENALKLVRHGSNSKIDVIYPQGHPKYGQPQGWQADHLPVKFTANALNYGSVDQHNLRLNVKIYDGNTNLLTTLSSPIMPTLKSGNIASYQDLSTSSNWIFSAPGNYTAVFILQTDSLNIRADSANFEVSDYFHAAHFNSLDNTVGTEQDVIALAQKFTFPACDDPGKYYYINGLEVYVGGESDPNGSIIIEIYDADDFSYGFSGGPTGSPVVIKSFNLDSNKLGGIAHFDLSQGFGNPLTLPSDKDYYVIINLLPNARDGIIQIGNDQTIRQDTPNVAMQAIDGSWLSGFENSYLFTNLWVGFEFNLSQHFHYPAPCYLSSEAEALSQFQVYPNPSRDGRVSISITEGGSYQLQLIDATGRLQHSESVNVNGREKLERNFTELPSGVYWLRLNSESRTYSQKLMIR